MRAHTFARPYRFDYDHVLGTSFELQVEAESDEAALRAESEALAEVDRLEPILSGWSPASELARWQATHGIDVPVSDDLAEVLALSEDWRMRTGGAFDPAAQAIIALLASGSAERGLADAIRALGDEMRGPRWKVDRIAGTARRHAMHAFSLDAIAKGYIVSRAAMRAAEVHGVSTVLLNIGGDLQHLGPRAVRAGIANPFAPAENVAPVAVVRLESEALATSGGYRRGFIANGRRVSHIVDPRTGSPADRIASASVFAPDCATADALSTAFSVMAPDESVRLADALPGVGCLLIEADGTMTASAAWKHHAVTRHDETNHSR